MPTRSTCHLSFIQIRTNILSKLNLQFLTIYSQSNMRFDSCSLAFVLLVQKANVSAFVPSVSSVLSTTNSGTRRSYPPLLTAHTVRPKPLADKKASDDSDEESEPIIYDDFDFVPGNTDIMNPTSMEAGRTVSPSGETNEKSVENDELSSLFQKSMQEDTKRRERITKNWSTGNWKCRGFSLDKFSGAEIDDESDSVVKISQLAFDETATGPGFGISTESIAVGRTDGSVFIVNLGEEYLTKFQAVPKLSWGDDGSNGASVKVGVELVSEGELKERRGVNLPSELGMDSSGVGGPIDGAVPFEIECQFQAHGKDESISALLFHDDLLYTAAKNVKVWKIDSVNGNTVVVPLHNLDSVSEGEVVALKTLSTSNDSQDASDHNVLFSANKDGAFSLWDMNGDLVYRCELLDDDGETVAINCADVDTSGSEHIIYLGLSSGHVVAYVASELVGSASEGDGCPVPKCKFLAHDPLSQKNRGFDVAGITAISCGGYGRSSGTASSSFLVTGGADGAIKQWEMIQQKQNAGVDDGEDDSERSKVKWNLMHWPRMSSQRMRDRAHVLKGHYEGPITALEYEKGETARILSAGADGTLRVWDPKAVEELYRMDGFEGYISSICLDGEVLITNGMSDFVCVHDFDTEDQVDNSYELDW